MKVMHQACRFFLLAALLITAFTTAAATTVTDIAGRQVVIPDRVDRIVLGEGRLFYALALLEGQQPLARIAGWQGDFRRLDTQTYARYRARFPQIDNIPLIRNTTADSISPEKVLTLQPDIAIFGLSGHGPGRNSELVNQLEKAGVPVVFVDFRTAPLKNTLPSIKILGQALHREPQAERFITFYQQQLKKVTDITTTLPAAQKPGVFIELRAATMEACCGSAGKGNMGDLIDLAGGNNLARDLLPGPLGQVNLEKVLALDPQIYIATGGKAPGATPGVMMGAQVDEATARQSLKTVLARPGIATLTAVKQHRAYGLWHNFYNSPYNILAIQAMAGWFYPALFSSLDPHQTEREMYQQFLAVEPGGTYWVTDRS